MAALFVVVGMLSVGPVYSQGEEPFDPLLSREVGPYDIAAGWVPPAPQVGFVNVAVHPTLVSTGETVMDARVLLTAEHEPGRRKEPSSIDRLLESESMFFEVVAVNTPESPKTYRANMKFGAAGNWVLRIRVDHSEYGPAEFEVPVVVLPAPIEPGVEGAFVFLGVFAVLVIGGLYLVWSIWKAQAARRRDVL